MGSPRDLGVRQIMCPKMGTLIVNMPFEQQPIPLGLVQNTLGALELEFLTLIVPHN
jgi:hypothetical protein